jgi:hypothetical protein
MLTWREYIALLLAGVWDFTQVALIATIVGLLSSSFSFADEVANLPVFVLCSGSVLISILLAILLKPHWALLPIFVLENTPLIQLIPNTTMGTLYIIRSHHKSLKQGSR